MKRSQLRKIIRESIKELIVEQTNIPLHYWNPCNYNNYSYPQYLNVNWSAPDYSAASQNFYTAAGSPSPGSVVYIEGIQESIAGGSPSGQNQNFKFCLKYLGQANGSPNAMAGYYTSITTATQYPNCNSCTDRWDCGQKGHWSNNKCVKKHGGQFATKQDCMMSGCEGMHDDGPYDDLTSDLGGGPISPITTDPQDIIKPKNLANIKRER